jgi:hypothetical protein
MQEKQVIAAFAALAQETRLRIVRILVGAGPDGLAAGQVGKRSARPPRTCPSIWRSSNMPDW